MRRTAAAMVFAFALAALAGPAASAHGPGGSATTCPRPYTAVTYAELLAQAQRLGVPEAAARGLYARVNKNADAWICQLKLPGAETHFSFIDNQAVGLERHD